MKNKKTRNMIIIAIVILLIGYLIMQKSKLPKQEGGNGDNGGSASNWDGTPIQCCYCNDSGSAVCSEFAAASCQLVSPNHVPAKNFQSLNCTGGTGGTNIIK